jgi:hypothetical protein
MPKNEQYLTDRPALSSTRHQWSVIDDIRKPVDRAVNVIETDIVSSSDQVSMADAVPTETTFTEDDPRACPRDPEEFRLALAAELDRLRQNKKIYEY